MSEAERIRATISRVGKVHRRTREGSWGYQILVGTVWLLFHMLTAAGLFLLVAVSLFVLL